MPIPRRFWDSNIVIGYLAGHLSLKAECDQIIEAGKRGELEILVSTMAEAEVAYLDGYTDSESEDLIREFFSRPYVVPAAFDRPVAAAARKLIRLGKAKRLSLKPPDAIHLATCEVHHIPILETSDPDLLRWNEQVGNPPIIIRVPVYEGQQRLIT